MEVPRGGHSPAELGGLCHTQITAAGQVWLHWGHESALWGHTQAKEWVDVGEGNTGENVPD